MKWPIDLEFGDDVLVITRHVVNHSDAETLTVDGDGWDIDDDTLIAVFRVPD